MISSFLNKKNRHNFVFDLQQLPATSPAENSFGSDEQMASSVMNQHHSHYGNYNQRNYNNNMTNSNSYSSSKGSSTSSSSTNNGYYNYPHSSSMNEITDNRNYHNQSHQQPKPLQNGQKSSSYYGINQNQQNQTNSISNSNQIELRKEQRERRMEQKRDFVPSFVLIDACKTNNDRKVREICRKLATLAPDDVHPVANFQDQTGRVSYQINYFQVSKSPVYKKVIFLAISIKLKLMTKHSEFMKPSLWFEFWY